MINILQILQIIFSVLIIGLVMIQGKGGGLSSAVGGSISAYGTRRGAEKAVFYITIIAAVGLVVNSILLLIL